MHTITWQKALTGEVLTVETEHAATAASLYCALQEYPMAENVTLWHNGRYVGGAKPKCADATTM